MTADLSGAREESCPVTDAEFDVLRGPLKFGERHPTRRGWYYWGTQPRGAKIWYRPEDREGEPSRYPTALGVALIVLLLAAILFIPALVL